MSFDLHGDKHVSNYKVAHYICNKLTGLVQLTRDIEPMLVYCWASVADVGPTLEPKLVHVRCLLRIYLYDEAILLKIEAIRKITRYIVGLYTPHLYGPFFIVSEDYRDMLFSTTNKANEMKLFKNIQA